jgi:zinc protease
LTKKDVNAISRKDILRFFERVATPGNMILAVSGRFDKETLFAKLNASFGSIGNESKTPVSYASLSVNSINGFLFVNRDNLTQASIKLGIITLQRPNPDYYPLTLMNWILGGAPFTSRISKKVREEEGLAYSAGSGLTSEYFYPGIFSAYLETKSSSAAYAVDLVYKEIEKFLYDGPTAEEISAAKQSLIDAFPASFKDAAVTASAFSQNQFAGESDNRFSTYRNRIAEITKEDIMRVAKKYLVKEHMTLTIVGNYRECMEGAMTKQDNFSNFKNVKLVTENDITRLLGD